MEKPDITNKLILHDLGRTPDCDIENNRFRDELGLYCWRGIVKKTEDDQQCIWGSTCSPTNFTDARTRFCINAGGCPNSFAYIWQPGDEAVMNRRGGIIVRNELEKCSGLAGFLACSGDGLKQSLNNVLDSDNRKNLYISIGGIFGIAILLHIIGPDKIRKIIRKKRF